MLHEQQHPIGMTNETVWYFAIGSMINPVSCAARDMFPKDSKPAELLDHHLYFFGEIGIAEALPREGSTFHGVAHLMDFETMERLDSIEIGYIRVEATAKFYDGSEIQVQVYSRSQDIERSPIIDKPPGERYIEIIVSGCHFHGVDQNYIDSLKTLDMIPRPTPDEFLTHGTLTDDLPLMTKEDISEIISTQGRIIWTFQSKVFEFTLEDKTCKAWIEMVNLIKTMGFEGEVMISKIAYDPKYGVLNSLDECTREHSAYREDGFVRYMTMSKLIEHWKVIGRYSDQVYRKETNGDLLWYFAIGSMIHPMSCQGRNVIPKESKPAVLMDYRLYFFGPAGVAEALPAPGQSFHGVAHLVDTSTMERLDSFEIGYIRAHGIARSYDGVEFKVQCYSRPLDVHRGPDIDKNPTERYLDIIASGCEHHGVLQQHVDFLRSLDKQPRPKPIEFLTLGELSGEMISMSATDVQTAMASGERILVTVNGKVFELTCDKSDRIWNIMANGPFQALGTFESEVVLSQTLFDPLYGICLNLEDVTREHSAYIEDMHARFSFVQGRPTPWKVVAKYADQKYKD